MPEPTSKSFTHSDCRNDLAPLERRNENSKLTINKLPPEILSYILLIGTESDRGTWRWKWRKVGSQHIASHVCSHWRDVSVGTPSLWKFIHIFGLPNEYTSLCITRAGNTLLDVLIDMFELVPYPNFPYNPVLSTKPTYEILRFLTMHGAGAHRWRSLFVRFPESDLLPMFIGFLNNNSPAYLRLLHFECANWSFRHEDSIDELILAGSSEDIGQVHNLSSTLLGSSLSSLVDLELVSSSGNYTYTPLYVTSLPTLRTLSITPSSPYIPDLANLLLLNPQLESLSLHGGYYYGDGARSNRPDRYATRPVVLPALRSLYISAVDDALWVVNILSTIRAPMLSELAIRSFNQCTFGGEQRESLVSYLASGGPGHSDTTYAPAYPSLQSFNVFHFPCRKKEFTRLMSSMPQLTHLIARRKQAEWLSGALWMLPKLESLEVPQISVDAAMKLLRLRVEAGVPIKSIKLQGGSIRSTTLRTEIFDSTSEWHPNAIPKYEYHRNGNTTEPLGDLRSIQQRSEEFSKECEDRLEHDLEDDRRDEFFDGDYMR
ncbi:unnamed protein product [Rhizoctonia solani]|uniref:F-box domain-containing protein n=1 Tax=Rhizoctonia solani TaxID=456999 RepID=A0A8H2WL80_9AGAM|nr:unnamed protein product [Rhizoctonia solani]